MASQTKGLVLKAAEGKRVVWKAPGNQHPSALLSLANTEGARISGITFDAGGQIDYAVRLHGHCSGLELDGVDMLNAGKAGLAVHDCVADKDRPVKIHKCRFANPGGKPSGAAVLFKAEYAAKGMPPQGSQNVQIDGCVAEGPFSSAAFQFDGSAGGIEIRHCRAGRAPNGVLFRKQMPPAEAIWQVRIVNNTFQAEAGIVCEDPPEIMKRPQNKIVVERNYFIGEPARVGADPNAKFVTAQGNYRKTGTPGGSPLVPTTEVPVDLPTEPQKFLQYGDSCPLAHILNNQPVGAPPG